MELGLFDEVADLVRSMVPDELGPLRLRSHRRGIKVWFESEKPGREHYEAQLVARKHIDGADGMVVEIGFHSEHRDAAANEAAIAALTTRESEWRQSLGDEAEVGVFFGADNWRRVSEAWFEPDLDDPEMAFEMAARLVDYVSALEPVRR